MKRSLTLALVFGLTATAGFCLAAWIREDLVYQSTQLSWQVPLNAFTFPGLLASTLIFSCQQPGPEIGCEWYKMFPTFVAVNSLTFAAMLFPLIHLFRRFRRKDQGGRIKAFKLLIEQAGGSRK